MAERIRDSRIDFIKGMLIWGIIYGHGVDALWGGVAHNQVWLHTFVRTYDLPFFMLLSGYFLKRSLEKRGGWGALLNRVTMIVVPIVVWTLLRGVLNVFGGLYYFLWAVFWSALICMAVKILADLFLAWGGAVWCVVFTFVCVVLHLADIPYNMFYLFPFFAVGFMLHSVEIRFSAMAMTFLLAIFAVGLCFWSPQYTPWSVTGLAWKQDLGAIGVYCYRFVLALVGICIMMKVFGSLRSLIGVDSWLSNFISVSGKETLALYLMHIFLFSLLKRICSFAMPHIVEYVAIDNTENLIGYVIAPIVSFLTIFILMIIIRNLRTRRYLAWILGFKV